MAKKQARPASKTPFIEITLLPEQESNSYLLKPGVVCRTEPKKKTSRDDQPIPELALDATEGFIPLWSKNTTLRWRFRESSLAHFSNPSAKKRKDQETAR